MRRVKEPQPLPDTVDVLIVGAGPHALAMASRLLLGPEAMRDVIAPEENFLKHRPSDVRAHLKKMRRLQPNKLAVVDSSGAWMKRWQNQFQALQIEFLRSHEMMHPDAFDHSSLTVWADANRRSDFLHIDGVPRDKKYHGPFTLPSNKMMLDFCKCLVKCGCLEDHLWHGHVESICRCQEGMTVTVRSPKAGDVHEVTANHVVLARGPTWRRQWPEFYHTMNTVAMKALRHAWDLFDNPAELASLRGTGVIVGGGLTSAHLCVQLAPHGQVHLLIRRDLRVKQYDLELTWMGTGRWDHRRVYEQAPLEKRPAINKAVRDGGSITPELYKKMKKLVEQGSLIIHEFTEVVTATFEDVWSVLTTDEEVLSANYLICASGTSVDVAADPLLGALQKVHPLKLIGGLPVLTESLQWGDLPVYVMGNVAALELGPDAVNMNGAARGSLRIGSALANASSGAPTARAA